jgi:hypothetical protein
METNRHDADNGERYRLYFGLLTKKVKEFEVLPRDTYNMDEKGFMIGVIGKTKRVFDKVLYKDRRFKQASHDANREWVTVIGCICADGTTLPPAVIFSAASEKVQANWYRISIQRLILYTSRYHLVAGRTTISALPGLSRCFLLPPRGKLGEGTDYLS